MSPKPASVKDWMIGSILFLGALVCIFTFTNGMLKQYLDTGQNQVIREPIDNSVSVSGTIKNNAFIGVKSVELQFTIYDKDHVQINSIVGKIDSDRLPPGGTSTFHMNLPDPQQGTMSSDLMVHKLALDPLPW